MLRLLYYSYKKSGKISTKKGGWAYNTSWAYNTYYTVLQYRCHPHLGAVQGIFSALITSAPQENKKNGGEGRYWDGIMGQAG